MLWPTSLSWSKDRPEWQRDALRRFCVRGGLDGADLDELTVLCKSKGNVPLATGYIPDPEAATMAVTLRAIRGVENVNALKPDECLTFDKQVRTGTTARESRGTPVFSRRRAARARRRRATGFCRISTRRGAGRQRRSSISVPMVRAGAGTGPRTCGMTHFCPRSGSLTAVT